MRDIRIHSPTPLAQGQPVELTGSPARHLTRVLRLGAGDRFTMFDGRGGEYEATLSAVEGQRAIVDIGAHTAIERESPLSLHLVQALPKGEKADWVVQKAVELGADAVTFVSTERTVVKLRGERAEKRLEHWRAVCASACEQCGRNRIPAVGPVTPLATWLGDRDRSLPGFVLSPAVPDEDPAAHLELRQGVRVDLLVGPEGGLSDDEVTMARTSGMRALQLGPRVLRTETAGLAALTALQVRWGDMG